MTAGYDSHYRRYDRIYQAFLQAQIPLVGLLKGTKRIYNTTAKSSILRTLYEVEAAMDAGLSLGAVTHQATLHGINPLGFWDLDIDGPHHGLDLSPFTYRVRREGETTKAHYLARLPDPSASLTTSYSGEDYDLCTWNTVMPGSVHETGTVYHLEYLKEGVWIPWDGEPFSIEMLPAVDPEGYRPRDAKPRRTVSGKVTPPPVKLQKPAPAWVPATGSLTTRIKMAVNYLRFYAWRSVSGKRGHNTLLVAVTNLRLFHRLEERVALRLVQKYFNPRCSDHEGRPYGWTEAEIRHKWKEAGKPGFYPTLGVKNPKATKRTSTLRLEAEVALFLEKWTVPGGQVEPALLRGAFIATRGGEDVTETAFGRAVSKVTGIRSTTPHGKRVYQGFSLEATISGVTLEGEQAA